MTSRTSSTLTKPIAKCSRLTYRADAMDIGLAAAGAVIGTILALLKQLQAFGQDLDPDDGDQAQLNEVVQTLGLQRSIFEDTTLELLYDILPSADLAAFFKAPEDSRWQEAPVQAKANERLGKLAKEYWETCVFIQKILLDIKQDADNVLFQDLAVSSIQFPVMVSKTNLCNRLEVQQAVLLTSP